MEIDSKDDHIATILKVGGHGSFTASEAREVDAKLSRVQSREISEHQVKGIMDYIDSRLLHDAVSPTIKDDLEKLYNALSERYFDV